MQEFLLIEILLVKDDLTFLQILLKTGLLISILISLEIKKCTYIFSSIVVVVSLVSIFFVNGLDQGVDFVGGRTFQVKFEKPVDANRSFR